MDKQSWLTAKLEDLSAVDWDFGGLARKDRVLLCFNYSGRDHKSEDRIKDRREGRDGARPQKIVNEPPSREPRGRPRVLVTIHHHVG
jgi:hypothetical protein